MKNYRLILLAIVLAAAAAYYFFPGDKRLIERQFSRLTWLVTQTEDSGSISKIARARAFQLLFDENIRIRVPAAELTDEKYSKDLAQRFLALSERASEVLLAHDALDFTHLEDGEAEVRTQLSGHAQLKDGRLFQRAQTVNVSLRKDEERGWLFTVFEALNEPGDSHPVQN